jgi:hypothetical protein
MRVSKDRNPKRIFVNRWRFIQPGVYSTRGGGEHRAKGGSQDRWPAELNIREWPVVGGVRLIDKYLSQAFWNTLERFLVKDRSVWRTPGREPRGVRHGPLSSRSRGCRVQLASVQKSCACFSDQLSGPTAWSPSAKCNHWRVISLTFECGSGRRRWVEPQYAENRRIALEHRYFNPKNE